MRKFYYTVLFLLIKIIAFAQTNPTGNSSEVGITEGELSVSLTGAANYKIPIALPSGINGIVPQINLAYNSQGGLGLAGFGWNIMGISAITRVPSTMYHDGIIDPVDFNDLDRFALDDKRLILKSSEKYGVLATKKNYETEIFSNLKISSYSGFVQNNTQDITFSPIDYFIVEYPDGSFAKYENHGSAIDWTITSWENPQGVFISYEYNTEYSGPYSSTMNSSIEKIKYGSLKSSNTQINEVQFVYKSHYTNPQVYVGGKSFIRNKILSAINIKSNNIGFRSYSLAHDASSLRYPRLKSIVETSGDGTKSNNPTVFTYEENQLGLVSPTMEFGGTSNAFDGHSYANVTTGDFDGDGDLEFIQFNDQGLSFHKILDNNEVVDLARINTGYGYSKFFAISSLDKDLKVSNKQNLCIFGQVGLTNNNTYRIYSYNTAKKTLELDYEKLVPNSFTSPSGMGDFDGDGLTELIGFNESKVGDNVELINLDRHKTDNFHTKAGFIDSGAIRYGDINGDGKTDLIVFRGAPNNDITVYTLKDKVFTKLFRTKQNMPGNIGEMKWGRREVFPIVMGDFNGDGKTDIFLVDLKKILLSTGGDFFVEESLLAYNPQNYESFDPELIFAFDYNNDGTTDVLSIKPKATGYGNFPSNLNVDIFYRTNSWFNAHFDIMATANFANKLVPLFTRKNKSNPFKMDLALLSQFSVSFFSNNSYVEGQNLLRSITLGNGIKDYITYDSLCDGNGIYFSASSQVYPNLDLKFSSGFKVVSQLEKQSNNQYKKQLFKYHGAVMNLEGLGFLGFRSTLKTNWHNDTSQIISYVSKNDISLRGANIENYEVLGLHEPFYESINEPSSFITKSLLTYQDELSHKKVYKIKNTVVKHFNGLEDTTNETRIDYNDYNNPTKITAETVGGSITHKSVTDIEYQNLDSPVYVVGRPVSKIQNVTLGSEKMRTEELYEYNSQQLLSQIQKKGDETTSYITENREYDDFGNIIKRTLKAGQDFRELNYEYDLSGRFMSKETDAEKLVTSYVYNPVGTLKSITNPLLRTTSFEYDSWFRKKYETNYLSNIDEYKYLNSNGNTIVTKIYADGQVAEQTFDDLGRKIKSGSKNIMGSFNYISYEYDIQDRNFKISEPYVGSASSQWNEIKYDNYGRIETQKEYTGRVTNFLYNGLTTKIDDGTISKTYKKDAVGNIVSMFDIPSNEIKYTYFANGNLKESEYNGVKTTILQDGWGRKKELKDSSAGKYIYEYNDFGELVKEITPKGITNYTLDDVGKITAKRISGPNTDSETTYTYDSESKLLLKSEFRDPSIGSKPITIKYYYDDYKRMYRMMETTPFAYFIRNANYDDFGRVDLETITSGASGKASSKNIEYSYKNGFLWQMRDNSDFTLLWELEKVNAKGQMLTAQTGPLTMTNTYDNEGFILQGKYSRTSNSANVLTLNTLFDSKKGNLKNRSYSSFGLNEKFEYDDLDRLIEFTNTKGLLEKQQYDDQGRITKNDLGDYVYGISDKPYQNNSITVSPEALIHYSERPTQIIAYNSFKCPIEIDQVGIEKISFSYNDSNSRTAIFYGGLQDEEKKLERPLRKYYSSDGTMEIKQNMDTGATEFTTYIGGDGYSAPVALRKNDAGYEYLFLQRDYQGSILSIADSKGTMLEKRSFDAWGGLIYVEDQTGNTLSGLTVLDRGYTGHEHLQSVGLINMNARLYDPKLHRFLQPDNNVQDPFNTQNYNRYGYVMNNPLRYTDPSGEFWNVVFGYLFATYVKGAYESGGQLNPGKWDSNAWTSAFSGAASGAFSYYTTGVVNNYLDNYNNKPALGASAVGLGENGNPFIQDYNFSFKDDPANIYADPKSSGFSNGDVATLGSILGGLSGVMNELPIVQFHNAAPAGKFAVNFNGSMRYWSDSFKGGTRLKVPSSFVQAAKSSSNSLKLASKFGGYASITGSYLSYYGALENLYGGNYYGASVEWTAAYFGNALARSKSDIGIAWTVGWNILGPAITNSEPYNRFFFGRNSAVYQYLEMKNGWYESKIFKD